MNEELVPDKKVNHNKGGKTLVMKFGGTSVGSVNAYQQVFDIVSAASKKWSRLVVVISAMSGVTDLLLESADRAVEGDSQSAIASAEQIRAKHFVIADELIPDPTTRSETKKEIDALLGDFTNLCRAIEILGEATPRALDAVASLGERMSVRLLTPVLTTAGIPAEHVDATRLVITDRQFQVAHPNYELSRKATAQVLKPIFSRRKVAVVTGFIGSTSDGITTTLGRGGSDYSAAILGKIIPADDVWIWTDVDGVMSADPRIVPDARSIPVLSYREISELAYFGAKVLHPKTIRPVIEAGIGLRVCNTFQPAHPGTRLVDDSPNHVLSDSIPGIDLVKAVTAIRGLKLLTVEGRGMLGVPGVAARTFTAVANTGTSVPMITQASSEQSICFAVPGDSADKVIQAVKKEFSIELAGGDIDRIWATDDVTIITVVGVGMRNTPGIAGRIFTALGDNGVNVIAIAQGSSEVSISLVVDAGDTLPGVRALHSMIVDRK